MGKMMENKVYVVVFGEYSDKENMGVFSTKEKAEEFVELEKESQKIVNILYSIQEHTLDVKIDLIKEGYHFYTVQMSENGDVDLVAERSRGGWTEYYFIYSRERIQYISNHCMAKSKEGAVKITNELRTRLIKLNQFHEIL